MKSFIKNFLTTLIFLAGFFVFSGAPTVEACEILNAKTRPPGLVAPGVIYPEYSQVNPDIFYLDIRTSGCNISGANQLIIKLMDNDLSSGDASPLLIETIRVALTPPTSATIPPQTDWYQTDQNDFTIPIRLGERGVSNSCEGSPINFSQWQVFLQTGLAQINPGPALANFFNGNAYSSWQYVFSESLPDCMLYFELDIVGGNSFSIGGIGNPVVSYKCDSVCNFSFLSTSGNVAGSYCPIGINPLEYESVCADDGSTTTIIISGSNFSPAGTPQEYSEAPLAPLPGFTGNPDLGQWLQSLFTILIVIAGILALIMIIVGGITYITSESFGGKGQGKTYIINAIAGLVLALGAWVILNTINPNLAEDLNIRIPSANLGNYAIDPVTGSVTGCKNNVAHQNNCPDCVPLSSDINSNPNNGVKPVLATKLLNFRQSLAAESFNWRVTEAFPPTVTHCSECHYNGTCVDVNFVPPNNTPPVESIISVLQAAQVNGLRAVYETNNMDFKNQLLSHPNISTGQVIHWAAITAPHFSVYNQ